ncbi:polysaccharide pyruvyl transferase family protein [Rathayibacter tanaceti]|uniref:Colanic acid biosynthesis protein n=1 Tax=Rathayibacter tanaceti TaxID=1671680 RepID=A0A162GSR3_9MICO|nr:polysaccharide pyruvyl transferase family protein [Rathayibacter tanaceti]KZX22078.1 colanic acid biosynthesis protein [Rathayibacter tanaceti]
MRLKLGVVKSWKKDFVTTTRLPARRDAAVLREALASLRPEPEAHLVLAAPGSGNIGDQAMLEAFLENTTGPVIVVQRYAGDAVIPEEQTERVELVELPHLVYGVGDAHADDLRRYAALVRRSRSVSVVGADMMDGKYSLRGSVRRSLLAQAAAEAGVPTRILGFSWNASARLAARHSLVAASRAGAVPLLRDPLSAERARRNGVARVEEVTDIVFSARTRDPRFRDALDLPAGVPFALVNASALVAGMVDQVPEYAQIVDRLRAAGVHVVLLPHVSRPVGDDKVAVRAVAERVGTEGVTVVDRVLMPAEIRSLAEDALLTVTGRMHLAIMSLSLGVPAITLATQGKVEGIMRLIGLPQLCVEPVPASPTASSR